MGFLKADLLAAVLAVLLLLGYVLVSLRFGLGAVPYGPAFAVVAREILLADSPAAAAVPPAQPLQEPLPQVASGDVTPTTAVVWARWGEPGEIFVRLWKEQEGESSGRRLGP